MIYRIYIIINTDKRILIQNVHFVNTITEIIVIQNVTQYKLEEGQSLFQSHFSTIIMHIVVFPLSHLKQHKHTSACCVHYQLAIYINCDLPHGLKS